MMSEKHKHFLIFTEICNVLDLLATLTYRNTGNETECTKQNTETTFLLPSHPYLKVLITCLLLVLEVCNMKPTYRRSWAGNLLMFSDLTLGPCFKVK